MTVGIKVPIYLFGSDSFAGKKNNSIIQNGLRACLIKMFVKLSGDKFAEMAHFLRMLLIQR